jgi:DNA-binding YbaB/EbfC family protein
MTDMLGMVKQAMEMQRKMQAAQARLDLVEVTGRAGGDAVQVVMNGNGAAKRVTIAPELLNEADKTVLEHLLIVAFNNARVQAESAAQKEMAEAMGPLAGLAGGMGGGGLLE